MTGTGGNAHFSPKNFYKLSPLLLRENYRKQKANKTKILLSLFQSIENTYMDINNGQWSIGTYWPSSVQCSAAGKDLHGDGKMKQNGWKDKIKMCYRQYVEKLQHLEFSRIETNKPPLQISAFKI